MGLLAWNGKTQVCEARTHPSPVLAWQLLIPQRQKFLIRFTPNLYRPAVPDTSQLHPATADEIAEALAFALRYDGRKRVHDADQAMGRITAPGASGVHADEGRTGNRADHLREPSAVQD